MNNENRLIEISEKYAKSQTHDFLAESLTTPMVNQANANRIQMHNAQLTQSIQIDQAEIPYVYTGFENQISKYSTGYTKLESGEDFTVIGKFVKNPLNYVLITRGNTTGTYDVIHRRDAEHLTEEFGYKLNNEVMDSVEVGDVLNDGLVLNYDKSFTPNMNFKYGVNLKICYLPYEGNTNEDGLVVSESTAEKMSSWFVKKTFINVNTNHIPLNLYGTREDYKSFPSVGERVRADGKLMGTRIISHDTLINKFKDSRMDKDDKEDSVIFEHGEGIVIDIDMWNNNRTDALHKEIYNTQLAEEYDNLMRYYREAVDFLEPIMNNPENELSSDLLAYYNQIASYLDPLSEFERDGTKFENIVISFVTAFLKPLNIGSKITARYGNKGVVSKIVKDDELPMLTSLSGEPIKDGKDKELFRADMCVNPFGVMNRLNISQCVEMELNYLKNRVRYAISQLKTVEEKKDLLFNKFLKLVDPKLVNSAILKKMYETMNDDEKFFQKVVDEGFAINQPPFWNNINGFGVYRIYEELGFDIEPNNMNFNKIPIGELYYIRLKHEPDHKLSARSSDNINMSGLPTRTGDKKSSKAKVSNTPIRIGEMETTNLGMVGSLGPVTDLLMSYANSPKARLNLILSQLTSNPFDIKIKKIESKDSNNKKILKSYLNALGIKFINEKDPEEALKVNSETSDCIDSLSNSDLLILASEMELRQEGFDLAEFMVSLDEFRKIYDIEKYIEEEGWNKDSDEKIEY